MRASPWNHQNAQDVAQGEVMEELGKLLHQNTVPTAEHKNHGREQPGPGQRKILTGIHLA